MSDGLLLGIDEGTTAVKAALYDTRLRPIAQAERRLAVSHPHPGWVEQDPEEILEAVVETVAEVLHARSGRVVLGAGLDHQGESVLAWDARDGQALCPVIGWQDKRHEALLADLDARTVARSGLPLDPYFSAGKLTWLLAENEAVAAAAAEGTLRLGTLDSFLCERLGGRFATDLSTASRTQLLAVGGRDWDQPLIAAFGLQRSWLARIEPSFGRLGELRHERWPVTLGLTARVVDQQAALAGSGAVRPGELKATFGTGVFVLGRTTRTAPPAGLLPTVAWAAPADAVAASGEPRGAAARHLQPDGSRAGAEHQSIGAVHAALEGGVFTAGAMLEWLAGGLGLAADVPALAALAAEVPDSAGVMVLPALSGLGAPWWRPSSRGVVGGLHAGVTPGHLARAALEGIAWRVADIVEAIATVTPVRGLRVDGGLSNDDTLMQIQADALGLDLTVGPAGATALGAALLAGVGAGVFASVEAGAALLPGRRTVLAGGDGDARAAQRERWRAFVVAAAVI